MPVSIMTMLQGKYIRVESLSYEYRVTNISKDGSDGYAFEESINDPRTDEEVEEAFRCGEDIMSRVPAPWRLEQINPNVIIGIEDGPVIFIGENMITLTKRFKTLEEAVVEYD